MKALIALVSLLSFILGSLSVQAASHPRTYTATINKDGTVLTQTPQWIATVEHTNQEDYAALYNVKLVPSAFKKAPAYCNVSTYDYSSYEHTLHGVAKLSSKPTKSEVNVIGLMLGLNQPSGDSSMSFYLVCGQ